MSIVFARLNRLLIAATIGLLVSVVCALSIEQPPSAAITRGDFPAFYSMASIANRGEGTSLYDLEVQRRIQNEAWPSLQGSLLPAAYPAFLAFMIKPLAALPPSDARLVWTTVMVICVILALIVTARSSPHLHGLTWQVVVIALLFSPLLMGALGGQIVGLSVLLYAGLISLEQKKGSRNEVLLGLVTGLWMYKPHFALAVVVALGLSRRWRAVGTWFVTSLLLWLAGVSVAGVGWLSHWYSFAKTFAHIDLTTNASQMTGVIPFLYVLTQWLGGALSTRGEVWEALTLLSSLVVPGVLVLAVWLPIVPTERGLIVLLGPLLVLFAPAVNFYDLSLAALSLLAFLRPSNRMDIVIAISIVVLSQCAMLLKDEFVSGSCFVLALILVYFFTKAAARERAQASRPQELLQSSHE